MKTLLQWYIEDLTIQKIVYCTSEKIQEYYGNKDMILSI